jgi:hypothetical protein
MPKITNTFLKSKMNKDLDSRILPNGEYRDAQNLQISRSEGSEVGEFENIPGNVELQNLYTGNFVSKFIGQFTNETSGDMYLFNSSFTEDGICPRDTIVYFNSALGTGDAIVLQDNLGAVLNPEVLGIKVGMSLWGNSWGPSGIPSGLNGFKREFNIIKVTSTEIQISTDVPTGPDGIGVGDTIYIGYINTIYSITQ